MSEAYFGEIRIMAFNYAPKNWAQCNGQIIPIQQNTALFSILGTTFGGDGKTNFGLPNFQGRAPMHVGQGQGLTYRTLGEQNGDASVTLTASEMANHTHSLNAQNINADKSSPDSTNFLAKGNAVQTGRPAAIPTYSATMTPALLSAASIGANGGGQPHTNMQPLLTLNFCIALYGIYPPRG